MLFPRKIRPAPQGQYSDSIDTGIVCCVPQPGCGRTGFPGTVPGLGYRGIENDPLGEPWSRGGRTGSPDGTGSVGPRGSRRGSRPAAGRRRGRPDRSSPRACRSARGRPGRRSPRWAQGAGSWTDGSHGPGAGAGEVDVMGLSARLVVMASWSGLSLRAGPGEGDRWSRPPARAWPVDVHETGAPGSLRSRGEVFGGVDANSITWKCGGHSRGSC